MKKISALVATMFISLIASSQIPEITSWIRNTNGATGYAGIPSNVQIVQYSADNVYISCTCIPGYSIGPWNNPNVAANQNFVFAITRHPMVNTGTPTAVGLGHIGVWTNGVSIFNVSDAQSYNNQGIWNRNALFFEGPSFDNCLGHAQQQGEYHHHVSPTCLYDETDSTHHSPIIGYAFDGFPVYGAYAFADTTGGGGIKRMKSSFVLSTNTTRANGPAVGGQYPAGAFIEDYIYTAGSGDLDERNGRFAFTPEYPQGTYAYYVTLDDALEPAFPYTFIGSYYGVVQSGNTGMNSGHVTINEPTTVYTGQSTGIEEIRNIELEITPNPVEDYAFIYIDPSSANNIRAELFNMKGELLESRNDLQPSISYTIDFTKYRRGNYLLHLTSGDKKIVRKISKIR